MLGRLANFAAVHARYVPYGVLHSALASGFFATMLWRSWA